MNQNVAQTRDLFPFHVRIFGPDFIRNFLNCFPNDFKIADNGNVAPTRVIRGSKTNVLNPTDVYLDLKHNEVWAANMGNHSAVVFPRTANGDVAPLRIIRSAPMEKKALAIGNPGAVAYDAKRDEILAPN